MAMLANSRTLKELLSEYEWELPTSFIDIVFLLLLYYTLTMKFHTQEQRMEAWLPRNGIADDRRPPPPPPLELTIKVRALDGSPRTPCFQVDNWQTTSPNELSSRIDQLNRTCPGRFQAVIDGTRGCPFKHVMAALDACARAKVTKVSFRAPPLAGEPPAG